MGGPFDLKTAYNGVLADAAAFISAVKLVWIGIGTKEPERMYTSVRSFHETFDRGRRRACVLRIAWNLA